MEPAIIMKAKTFNSFGRYTPAKVWAICLRLKKGQNPAEEALVMGI